MQQRDSSSQHRVTQRLQALLAIARTSAEHEHLAQFEVNLDGDRVALECGLCGTRLGQNRRPLRLTTLLGLAEHHFCEANDSIG